MKNQITKQISNTKYNTNMQMKEKTRVRGLEWKVKEISYESKQEM